MSVQTVKAFVAVAAELDQVAMQSILPSDPQLEVVAMVEGLQESWEALQTTSADLVLVCTEESDDAVTFIEATVNERPGRPVIALVHGAPNGFVGRVFAAGADDLVAIPRMLDVAHEPEVVGSVRRASVAREVLFAIHKVVARRQTATGKETGGGHMITVLGPKGGVGKTLTTASLAVTLAAAGHRVLVVDLDLQFGDIGLALGLSPGKTISDLASSGGSLDAEKVEDYLAVHDSGARVLLAPTRPDYAAVVTVDFVRDLYEVVLPVYDYVIVDTPPGFTPEVIASIDASTDVCMIGMLDSLSLKNTKLGLETLELMGCEPDRVRLVLNRADSRVGITREDVHAIVGRPPDVLVPSHRDIPRAVNQGVPIVLAEPRSEAARSFRALAALYTGDDGGSRRRRMLRRRGGRS